MVLHENTDFSRISSCLIVHYPVDIFVQADSIQVSFNTSDDTKFNLESGLLCLHMQLEKFSMEFCTRSTICYFQQ